MPRGGGWEDVLAAIAGGLGGYAREMGDIDAQRERAAADEQRRRDREEELALRRQELAARAADREATAARQAQDDAGRSLDTARKTYGSTIDAPASIAHLADRAGRSHEVIQRPTMDPAQLATSAVAASPLGPMGMPSIATRFVPTAAEREQQQALDEVRALAERMRGVNPATAQAMEVAVATGKMPTFQPADFVRPKTAAEIAEEQRLKDEREFGNFRRRENYQHGLILERNRSAGGPPVVKDDPELPRGVRKYLGDLAGKYGNDREAALDELERATPKLTSEHTGLDVAVMHKQFDALFGPDPTGATYRRGAAGEALRARPASSPPVKPAPTPTGGPPVKPVAPPSSADASPGQVQGLKAQLAAAIQAGDAAKVAALRQQLATAAGR